MDDNSYDFGDSDSNFISLFIKASSSLENKNTFNSFKFFCESNTKNDYTLGLRLLLQNLDYVNGMNALWSRFEELDSKVSFLESVLKK